MACGSPLPAGCSPLAPAAAKPPDAPLDSPQGPSPSPVVLRVQRCGLGVVGGAGDLQLPFLERPTAIVGRHPTAALPHVLVSLHHGVRGTCVVHVILSHEGEGPTVNPIETGDLPQVLR